VVRRTKGRTEEEKRIREKEAIYRELIEIEAKKYGRTYEEEKAIEDEENRVSDAKVPDLYKKLSEKKGISIYEAELNVRIGFLQALNKYAPNYRDPSYEANG